MIISTGTECVGYDGYRFPGYWCHQIIIICGITMTLTFYFPGWFSRQIIVSEIPPIHFWEYFVSLTSNLCSTLAMGVPWYWAILHHIIIVCSLVYNNVYINLYLDVHICHTEVNISDFNNAPALYILYITKNHMSHSDSIMGNDVITFINSLMPSDAYMCQ